jgi:TolB-like protein
MTRPSALHAFFSDLRKKKIIEILAAFIGGGWLLVEVVERLFVGHYGFPEKIIDITVVSVIGVLVATLVWRWFCGRDKRPGNIKFEVLLVPLILLLTLAIDLAIFLKVLGIPGKILLVAAVALCLGVGWVILKLSQWAAAPSSSSVERVQAPAEPLAPTPAVPDKSIVVLPFANISPEEGQEYFCDGMTEEIIADLSQVPELLVISRSSAMTFKGTKKTIPEIAHAVNVRYVLEGSVRKAGKDLRITAQLIQADNDRHLWAEKYDGVLEDVFEIQEKVSRKIVEALKGHISPKDQRQMAARASFPNVGIYEAYSRAHYEFWKSEPESTERALHILEKAIGVFGEHPLLVSGIGAIHWQFYHQRGDLNEIHLTKIDECAKKLFAGDPASAFGHRLSSYLSLHAGDSAEAIKHLNQAMEGDPSDAETLLWLSYLLAVHAGRPDQARPVAERWVAIDPLNSFGRMSMEFVSWMKGDLESAAKGVEEWYNQDPGDQILAFYFGHLMTWTGRYEESLRIAEKMVQRDPGDGMGQTLLFLTLAVNGRAEEAKKAIPPSMREALWMDFHLPWLLAEGYALLGEKDEALRWLERAVERGIFNYPLWNEIDPLLASIRGEERFKKLMERVKQKWERFEA